MGRLFVGTSGWVYKGWAGAFYPEGLPARQHLQFYTTQFNTVEINATFYPLPFEKGVRAWHGLRSAASEEGWPTLSRLSWPER